MTNFDEKVKKFSTQKLCEIIITYRYMNIFREEAVICMQELASRREAGDQFDYETFIETEGKKLPDFKMNLKKKLQIGGFDLSALKGIK